MGMAPGPGLESCFWRSGEVQRYLLYTDTVACVLSLISVVASIKRLQAPIPGQSVFSIYYGPRILPFNLGVLACIYSSAAALPLLLMLLRPRTYYRWRLQLCLLNRLLRLFGSTAQLMTPAAREYTAMAVAAHAQNKPAHKALLLYLIQPAGFWMQQANFLVPWRWALPLQLINFAASLLWSASLPCWLQLLRDTSGSGQLPFGPAAVEACGVLQYLVLVLRQFAGDAAHKLAPDVCQNQATAVQVLQVVSSSMMLLLLPLLVIAALEHWLKRCFLRRVRAEQHRAQGVAPHAAAGSSAGAGSSRGAQSNPSTVQRPAVGGGNSSLNVETAGPLDGNSSSSDSCLGLQCMLNVVIALMCMPLLAWSVAEAVAARYGDDTSCMRCVQQQHNAMCPAAVK